MSLKGKRILITAGPTWVPIDSVRVISNIATGRTGMLLAQEALAKEAKVTLVLGPCSKYGLSKCEIENKAIRLIDFRFFSELRNILRQEFKNKRYDIVIHSAAVSDFKPKYKLKGKLNSHSDYNLKLRPLEKLVVLIRRLAPKVKLVMFKLEAGITDKALIRRAKRARDTNGADLVVANRLIPYCAFIVDKKDNKISARSKQELAKKLIKILS